MLDYVPIAATVADFYAQFGASATLVREATMLDPITGLPDSVQRTQQQIAGIQGVASRRFGELFPAVVGSQVFKSASELRLGDSLTVGGRKWRVGVVNKIEPGPVTLLYEAQLIA